MTRQDFSRGDGLDGLAQPHFIADQHPPGPHGKQRTFGLIGIHRHFEQGFQPLILNALGISINTMTLGGLAIAFLLTTVGVRIFNFMPQD